MEQSSVQNFGFPKKGRANLSIYVEESTWQCVMEYQANDGTKEGYYHAKMPIEDALRIFVGAVNLMKEAIKERDDGKTG